MKLFVFVIVGKTLLLMNVIFDTNAYRCLAFSLRDLSEQDKIININRIKIYQSKKDIKTPINFWVLSEILQHLCDVNDRGYKNCSETLKIMLRHSSSNGNAMFSPMFEIRLARKFEDKTTEEHYKKLEINTAKLAIEFAENGRSEVFEKYICDVANYVENYKNQLYKGFIDAKIELKKAGNKSIPTGNEELHYLVLISRINNILSFAPELNKEILDELNDTHYFGIARTLKVLNNGYGYDFLSDDFLNNFVDQAICDELGKNDDTILVTDDSGVISTFIEKNAANRTMKLNDYLNYIGFDQ